MKTDKPLSAKHKRFVRLVRSGKSATSAYAAAYNIRNTKATRAASCRLMKDARIIAAINKGRPAAQQVAAVPGKQIVNTQENRTIAEPKEAKAQIEENLREKLRQISTPETIQRFTLPSPNYQRPQAPNDQEALRRRLRMQTTNPKGYAFLYDQKEKDKC